MEVFIILIVLYYHPSHFLDMPRREWNPNKIQYYFALVSALWNGARGLLWPWIANSTRPNHGCRREWGRKKDRPDPPQQNAQSVGVGCSASPLLYFCYLLAESAFSSVFSRLQKRPKKEDREPTLFFLSASIYLVLLLGPQNLMK